MQPGDWRTEEVWDLTCVLEALLFVVVLEFVNLSWRGDWSPPVAIRVRREVLLSRWRRFSDPGGESSAVISRSIWDPS